MTQTEKRLFLIKELLKEQTQYRDIEIPQNTKEQKQLLRALFNLRLPLPVRDEFRRVQDEYLQQEIAEKGICDIAELTPVEKDIYLWQGDITTLKCGAIVNAANSRMLGCFVPCHGCIDNAIHTYAGVQLRAACAELMDKQGREEPVGRAQITLAYNLPCQYVLHTVGPIIQGKLTEQDCRMLASCYSSCLELAEKNGVGSVAFCCISTGEFHFPQEKAAEIAVETVKTFQRQTNSKMKVIFNVFKETDLRIYQKLLG